MNHLMQIINGQKSVSDVWHYLLGNYRYFLYYSSYKNLIRLHILEQIEFRVKNMDKECFNAGECKLCGCQTTALQMCNKACDKPCYPSMMNKKEWEIFKRGGIFVDGEYRWMLDTKNNLNKFKIYGEHE